MAESPELNEKRSGMASLMSLLSQAASSQRDWRDLARSLADQLHGRGLDWRDLARAAEQVRTKLAVSTAGADSAALLLDRVAILAMRLSEEATKASAEMLDACAPGVEPERMLRKVLTILRRQIPFDLATYSEYHHGSGATNDPTLVQARFAIDGNEEFRWPARWVEVPPGIVAWVEGRRRWISDVADFYVEYPEAETLKSHVVTREYERRGITSYLVATRMDGGRVTAALTLGRRRDGQYKPFNQIDQDRLDALRLEPVLRRVGEAFETRTATLAQDIAELVFTPRVEPIELANKAVRKLGEGFGWEYVALFRVNRARDQFEVVAEYDPVGKLQVSTGYKQGLQHGMLGHVLRERHELYAPNVRKKPPPYDYINTREAQASAMCLPIRLGQEPDAKIEWILDLESSQFDAFPQPEQDALKKIVRQIERSLQLWFEARLCAALLNLVEQGVVVLGERTRIERANAAARKLLGLSKDVQLPSEGRFRDLEAFAADRTTRELIVGGHASSGAHLRLIGPDGIERRALAGASYRDEAFHRRVWLLADVEQAEWIGALRYMEAAVRTIVGQAHGRLLLAGALLRRVQGDLNSESSAYSLLDRAARNLMSADIPYERIACVHDVLAAPLRRHGVLDLAGELRRFRDLLPEDEARAVKLRSIDDAVVVKGDPERLSFVFRSLLGHLLAVRAPETDLHISLAVSNGEAVVNITLGGANSAAVAADIAKTAEDVKAATRDVIAYAEARAVAAAAHGMEAVRKVIEAHGGRLLQPTERDGEVHVTICALPLATSEMVGRAKALTGEPHASGGETQ